MRAYWFAFLLIASSVLPSHAAEFDQCVIQRALRADLEHRQTMLTDWAAHLDQVDAALSDQQNPAARRIVLDAYKEIERRGLDEMEEPSSYEHAVAVVREYNAGSRAEMEGRMSETLSGLEQTESWDLACTEGASRDEPG